MPPGIGKLLATIGAISGILLAVSLVFSFLHLGGWLVLGLLGLALLGGSFWLDLLDGHAVADYTPGGESVTLLAQQMANRQRASAEEKLAVAAERAAARHLHIVARGVGLILTAAGFGLFFLA